MFVSPTRWFVKQIVHLKFINHVNMYLQLELEGHGIKEGMTITDPEMLEAMMEFREQVDETTDSKALQALKENVESKIEECIEKVDFCFRNKDYTSASEAATILRYLTRIEEAIIDKL